MSTKILKLPNGLIAGGEHTREIEILKLTGEHEDMIRDKKQLREGNIVDKLLKACIVRIGDVTDKERLKELYDNELLMADQQFILVHLRIWGIGKKYTFDATCPYCETIGRQSMDLTTLEVDEQKEEYRSQREFLTVIKLEDVSEGPIPIKFKHLYAKDMKKLEIIKQDFPRDKGTQELLVQLIEVNGKRPIPPYVKQMSWELRNAIRAEMDRVTGGIDMELLMECKKCDRQFKDSLPVELRDFFYPTADTLRTPSQATSFRSYGGTSRSSEPDGDGAPSQ